MSHQEIRFKILHTLYQKYYGGEPANYQPIDSVIAESDLEGVNLNVAHADVIYLRNSNLVEGIGALGQAHPVAIRITNYGIDTVESITEQALQSLSVTDDPEVKRISMEKNPPNRMRKFIDYIKQHPDFVASTLDKIIRTALGSISGTPTPS